MGYARRKMFSTVSNVWGVIGRLYHIFEVDIRRLLSDPNRDVAIASISFFEIALKYELGKLSMDGVTPDMLPEAAQRMGFRIVDVDTETTASVYRLKKCDGHKDPFDRMLIWYALRHGWTLVSSDGKLEPYEAMGLKVLRL